MIELYSNSPNKINYTVGDRDGAADATVFTATLRAANDTALLAAATPFVLDHEITTTGNYQIVVPQAAITGKKLAIIDIAYTLPPYGQVKDSLSFEISKRYISFTDINRILGEDNEVDWDTYDLVEQDIRMNIDAYCGQSFNSWYGERRVKGTGAHIKLPQHMDQLDGVGFGQLYNPSFLGQGYILNESGTSITNLDKQLSVQTFGGKPKQSYFNVKGVWGFNSVPNAVVQAAIALFKTNLCDDKEYRNRYIQALSNENFRVQLHDEAYSHDTTGNAFADDILDPYRVFYIGVI